MNPELEAMMPKQASQTEAMCVATLTVYIHCPRVTGTLMRMLLRAGTIWNLRGTLHQVADGFEISIDDTPYITRPWLMVQVLRQVWVILSILKLTEGVLFQVILPDGWHLRREAMEAVMALQSADEPYVGPKLHADSHEAVIIEGAYCPVELGGEPFRFFKVFKSSIEEISDEAPEADLPAYQAVAAT